MATPRESVYEEWDHELVESGHNSSGTVYYRVFKGTVNWEKKPGGMKPAIVVMMQYGDSEEWDEATDEIAFDMPAHILDGDLPNVLAAIDSLKLCATNRFSGTGGRTRA